MLILTQYVNLALSQLANETDEMLTMHAYAPHEDIFLSLVHIITLKMVRLFNQAGHILNYDQILQVDNGIAESVLDSSDPHTGSVILPNLVRGKFVYFSADNIDILDETLDGKTGFMPLKLLHGSGEQRP